MITKIKRIKKYEVDKKNLNSSHFKNKKKKYVFVKMLLKTIHKRKLKTRVFLMSSYTYIVFRFHNGLACRPQNYVLLSLKLPRNSFSLLLFCFSNRRKIFLYTKYIFSPDSLLLQSTTTN